MGGAHQPGAAVLHTRRAQSCGQAVDKLVRRAQVTESQGFAAAAFFFGSAALAAPSAQTCSKQTGFFTPCGRKAVEKPGANVYAARKCLTDKEMAAVPRFSAPFATGGPPPSAYQAEEKDEAANLAQTLLKMPLCAYPKVAAYKKRDGYRCQ